MLTFASFDPNSAYIYIILPVSQVTFDVLFKSIPSMLTVTFSFQLGVKL